MFKLRKYVGQLLVNTSLRARVYSTNLGVMNMLLLSWKDKLWRLSVSDSQGQRMLLVTVTASFLTRQRKVKGLQLLSKAADVDGGETSAPPKKVFHEFVILKWNLQLGCSFQSKTVHSYLLTTNSDLFIILLGFVQRVNFFMESIKMLYLKSISLSCLNNLLKAVANEFAKILIIFSW